MSALPKERVALCLQQLPPLPQVVSELLASFAHEDDVDVERLAHQISRDQAITAWVLRVANSSFYGLQSKVATIPDAVVVLGFRAVRSLVLAVGVNCTFFADRCRGFDAEAYRRHGIGTGMVAASLSEMAGSNRELAFTAGLLHDIGQLALAANFSMEYTKVLEYRAGKDCSTLAAERDVMGTDHAQVGGMLAEIWHFPESLRQALAGHHEPGRAAADSLANLIHIADAAAHALELSHQSGEMVMPIDPVAWQRIGGDWQAFRRILPQIETNFAETCHSLQS